MQYYNENPEKRAQDAANAQKTMFEGSNDASFYAPPNGVTTVRIMPPYNPEGEWYFETLMHYVPHMRGYFTCPGVFGDYCPICDRGANLYALGGEENVKTAKELQPNKYYLYNAAILAGKPSRDGGDSPNIGDTKKLTVLRAGTSVHKKLLELHTDEQLGCTDIFNLENGVNINIKRTGNSRNTTEYSVLSAGRSNFVSDMANKGINLQDLQLVDLKNAFPVRDDEFLEKCADARLAGNFPGARQTDPTDTPTPAPMPTIPPPSAPQPTQVQVPDAIAPHTQAQAPPPIEPPANIPQMEGPVAPSLPQVPVPQPTQVEAPQIPAPPPQGQ